MSKAALPSRPALLLEGHASPALCYEIACRSAAQPLLVVVPDDDAAATVAQDLRSLGRRDCVVLQGESHTPFEAVASNAREALARLALRQRLLEKNPPQTLIACAAALQGTWAPAEDFVAAQQTLRCGDDIDREALLHKLLACGYQRVNQVEDEGTFAVRGGTLDLFAPQHARPLRLDLFGDELASIRTFTPATQQLGDKLDAFQLAPIRDVVFSPERIARANAWLRAAKDRFDTPSHRIRELQAAIEARQYFFGIEALWPIFYGGTERVWNALTAAYQQLAITDIEACRSLWQQRRERGEEERSRAVATLGPQVEVDAHVVDGAYLCQEVREKAQVVHAPVWLEKVGTAQRPRTADFTVLALQLAQLRKQGAEADLLAPLLAWINGPAGAYRHVLFCCNNHGTAMRLQQMLKARRVSLQVLQAAPDIAALATGGPTRMRTLRMAICIAPLSLGIDDAKAGIALVGDVDLFGTAPVRREQRARASKGAKDGLGTLRDLRSGDLVIHQDHGIGRYEGLVRLVLEGVDGDFVQLTYADGDRLFVPVYRLSLLKRYHGSRENAQLDKLGGVRWERAKRRVRDAVLAMAHTLLALEARRKAQVGFALPAPNEAYSAFAASFPYEETPDQQSAIQAALADMQRDTPMDRLVCGDVGFGKTEVALRATFLAIEAGKQVAVLVPTTVLAEQHKDNFRARLGPHGAVVESLSRFRTAQEAKDVLQRVKDRQVDVLIGTHRLLSQDVHFADLGLLVVDEEQRFGVKHKERIKQLRAHVHVLTLSATPIPRTLHMATAGMRDLSLITTPPLERSAIRTEVQRYDEATLQEAIRREMHRGGQVFVVHNRIVGIDVLTSTIRRLVPEAEVLVGHGQMGAHALEKVMVDFVQRKAHVLVCTAIIESGIDIPSVNTMVVLRADTFGLSQLYQLRGRIGRGRDRAYAYLMLPEEEKLSKDAMARLSVLKRFSELGAGFQIASHDLELRGAGDLLGADQSGHIASVGFELYTELLREAVEQARGRGPREDVEPEIKVAVAAVFPERYMPEPIDRLTYYQRMAEAESDEAIYDVLGDVEQIFGTPPAEAESLVSMMLLRRRLRALGVAALAAAVDAKDASKIKIGCSFAPDAAIDRHHLVGLCQQKDAAFRLLPSGKLAVTAPSPALQPADPARDIDAPYMLGKDMLAAILQALVPLQLLKRPQAG